MKTTGYLDALPANRPRIFAHRGLTYSKNKQVCDENTVEAFELALTAGADYLESDIQVTKDQVPVLFHDRDLKRLLGAKSLISDLTFEELSKIELPLGGKIPSLARVLKQFPTAKFNLDIKTKAAESLVSKTLFEHNPTDRILISSFSERSRLKALANLPSPLASSAGGSRVLKVYLAALMGNQSLLATELATVDALQIPTNKYGLDFTSKRFLEQVLPSGVEIHYWTINEPPVMQELFAIGAHGIVTDRSDLAIEVFS